MESSQKEKKWEEQLTRNHEENESESECECESELACLFIFFGEVVGIYTLSLMLLSSPIGPESPIRM